MTLNNFKCNHLIPLHFKGLKQDIKSIQTTNRFLLVYSCEAIISSKRCSITDRQTVKTSQTKTIVPSRSHATRVLRVWEYSSLTTTQEPAVQNGTLYQPVQRQ